MSARLHREEARIGLSVIGLGCGLYLLAQAAIEWARSLGCGNDCEHVEAGDSE